MAIVIPGSGSGDPDPIEITYRPLCGLVEYNDKFWLICEWESDEGPNKIQLLSFTRTDGTLGQHVEVDLDEVLEGTRFTGHFLWDAADDEANIISGQVDVVAGVNSKRIIGCGAAKRLEPVLIENLLWFGINGYLLCFNLTSGTLEGKVTGEESERSTVYFTPLCELDGRLLCVFERVQGEEQFNSVLSDNNDTGNWVIDAWLSEPTLGNGTSFNGWTDGDVSIELGLCTVVLGSGIVSEMPFSDTETLGWGSSGTTEAIRTSDTATANQSQAGPSTCHAGGGTNYDIYWQYHHWGSGATFEVPYPPFSANVITNPNLEDGDTVLRYWEYSQSFNMDYSYEVNSCAYDVKESKSIIALYGTFISGGLKYHWNYFDPNDYENWESWTGPIGPGGIHNGPDKANTSGPVNDYGILYEPQDPGDPAPAEEPLDPFIVVRKTWVNAGAKPRFEVTQTTPPDHSLLECCRATATISGSDEELVIFGPREGYEGPNYTWNPEAYTWTAYDSSLMKVWEQTIAGTGGKQSRAIVAGGRVWTAISSGLVELALEDGEILRQTSWSTLGIPTDDYDLFELISDGNAIYLRASSSGGGGSGSGSGGGSGSGSGSGSGGATSKLYKISFQ